MRECRLGRRIGRTVLWDLGATSLVAAKYILVLCTQKKYCNVKADSFLEHSCLHFVMNTCVWTFSRTGISLSDTVNGFRVRLAEK